MDPQSMDKMASQVEGLFYDLQNRTVADIVRRIKKTDKITATADMQINRLLDLGNTTEFIEAELLRTTGYSNAKIWELYDQVVEDQYTRNKAVYEQINGKFVPYQENALLQKWYNTAVSRNQDEILNITQSLGFYVSAGGSKKVFTPLSEIYSGYLNHAAMDVLTGTQSYNTVLRRVSKELSDSGMQWVEYASGYHCRATTAARRAVLTGVNQMSTQINEQTAKELGTDTFEVTWHSGARPTHWWGGRVFTIQQLRSTCGLGNVDGLCGANCRHAYHAFIPGVSVRTYTDDQLSKMNAKEKETRTWLGKEYNAYDATAKQREMERTMRAQRSNICGLKSGGADQDDIMAAQSRYLNTMHTYATFSKSMGLKPDMERVYVDRLGRVVNRNGFSFAKAQEKGITSKRIPKEEMYRIDRKYIESNAFKKNFRGLSGRYETDEALYRYAKAGLTHRDGTNREDLYIISKSSGKTLGKNISSTEAFGVSPNASVIDAVRNNQGDLIGLHTHPTNTPPTGSDFYTAGVRKYNMGVAVCGDGTIYTYKSGDKFVSEKYIDNTIEKFKNKLDKDGKKLYSNDVEAHLAALDQIGKEYGISYETRRQIL